LELEAALKLKEDVIAQLILLILVFVIIKKGEIVGTKGVSQVTY